MSYPNPFQQTTQLLQSSDEGGLDERLGLYQVFQRLYENHPTLLHDLLSLEDCPVAPGGVQLFYVIGAAQQHGPMLTTNLLGSPSQTLFQPENIWILGRAPDAGISLGDVRLSRYHAAIQFVGGQGFELLDLGSTNGSFVNGEAVRHRQRLKEGDRIRLGGTTLYFFEQPEVRRLPSVPPELRSQLGHPPEPRMPVAFSQAAPVKHPPSHSDETMTFFGQEELAATGTAGSAGAEHRDRQARLLSRLRQQPET
jgi:pSer/pThr/pTyr-binding forkhead associated (FHA) protein